jgi:hypothetical protein
MLAESSTMASKPPAGSAGSDKGGGEPLLSADAYPNRVVEHVSSFPEPSIYFKVTCIGLLRGWTSSWDRHSSGNLSAQVYESEIDEPEAKIRRDVGKLYERWQEKYGRRWPENGMNTEDLVWLAEEAYKPQIPGGSASGGNAAQKLVPIEKEAYPGEFVSEPGGDDDAADGKKKKKKKRVAMSNYEATVAGGNWVTDEFESVDYEAGNLEQMWDMYLWDREGKPLMMPEGGPNEAAVRGDGFQKGGAFDEDQQ